MLEATRSQTDPTSLTVAEASRLIRDRQIKPSELTDAILKAVEDHGAKLNCYGLVVRERARKQARAMDELLDAGVYLGPLHGIPVAVKDCIDTAGILTTNGSEIEKNRVPDSDAEVVQRLTKAGAVLIGKANLYEWAYVGPSSLWGEVANPWNTDRWAGASSNGSGAAVAAGLALGAVGTDSGGSIRIPAAMCGVFGLKPTVGRVSRHGVWPHGSTIDNVGPLTRDAEGSAMMLEAMAGYDSKDPATWRRPPVDSYQAAVGRSVRGLRIGIPSTQPSLISSDDVRTGMSQVTAILSGLGCQLSEVAIPDLMDARTALWIISAAEAAEGHRHYLRTVPGLYEPAVRHRVQIGEFIPAPEYVHTQRVRQVLMNQMSAVFEAVEVVVLPCVPTVAWPTSEKEINVGGVVEDYIGLVTRFTPLFNLTGHPAASVLAGFNSEGMPYAVQIVAPLFDEATIFRVASALEQANDNLTRRPRLSSSGELASQ